MATSQQQLRNNKSGTTENIEPKQLSPLQRVDESTKGENDYRW